MAISLKLKNKLTQNKRNTMNHGSLFSGIGGFDLAAQWMGWNNKFHCEWNEFGQKVLNYYWPDAECFSDITKSDFTKYNGTIDIISGGFPCQPYSLAGKRKGKEDERHLWPSMLRAIREVQPSYVLGENVSGLVNWSGGLVFDEVQADLEAEGYEILPFLLPACGVNAPHKRERIWFVAYSELYRHRREERRRDGAEKGISQLNRQEHGSSRQSIGTTAHDAERSKSIGHEIAPYAYGNVHAGGLEHGGHREKTAGSKDENEQQEGWYENGQRVRVEFGSGGENASNASGERLQGSENNGSARGERKKRNEQSARLLQPTWDEFPTQPALRSRNDGIPTGLARSAFLEWEQGLGKLTPSKHRNESIKAYGNAIVPQVAFEIFKAIQKFDNLQNR